MNYLVLKQAHVVLALVSVCGFVLRWYWKRTEHPLASTRAVRIVPHVIDTLFLAAGVAMAVMIGQYPLTHGWLTAKVGGLLLYILLGMVAMHSAPGSRRAALAFFLRLAVYAQRVALRPL